MAFPELVQLDRARGLNLRHLSTWQDGDCGPVDGQERPGVVRITLGSCLMWDLGGEAADHFRSAIAQAAWTPGAPGEAPPMGEPESPAPAALEHPPPGLSMLGQAAGNYDPETGEPLDCDRPGVACDGHRQPVEAE